MRKRCGIILSAVLLICALASCGNSAEKTNSSVSDENDNSSETSASESGTNEEEGVYIMRVGHAQSVESPRHRSLLYFKEAVEKKTDGKVIVEIYADGELGDETEMTQKVEDGDLEAVRGGDLEYVPKTTMLGLPMIADNIEQARKLCYSSFVAEMFSSAEADHNMKVLAVGDDSGFRQITNNVHPITKPADMKGLKMRTVLQVIDMAMTEFGASTEMIPFTELYDALKNGKVDGQENPLALIVSNNIYEVQRYCTIIDYMFFAELMYVNLDWWNSLPEEYQKILTACAKDMMDENARITDAENESYIQFLKDNGCEVYILSEEERAAFQPLAERVWQKYIDDGRISKDELVKMLKIIGKSVDW